MLSLDDKQQIEHTRVEFGEVFILKHIEKVLCDRHILTGMTDIETTTLHGVSIDVISVGDDRGELGDQLDGLPHEIVARDVIGIGIKGVHLQHATGQDVHNVAAFQVDDVHNRTMVKRHILIDQLTESRQLLLVGQIARKKQISDFLEAEALFFQQRRDEIVEFIATIVEPTRTRTQRSVVITLVANDITDIGQSDKHTCAILVAQSALHTIFSKSLAGDLARVLHLIAQLVYQIFLSHNTITLAYFKMPSMTASPNSLVPNDFPSVIIRARSAVAVW